MLVLLLFAVSLAIATARQRAVEGLRASGPAIKRWGARILVLVGAWFILLAIFADFFARLFPV